MATFAILDLIGDIVSYIEEFSDLKDLSLALGPLGLFLILIFIIAAVILYIFSSLGLMELAKKNNISNPWLAFIPIGYHYLLGKLGFEVYEKNGLENKQMPYIMLALSAVYLVGVLDGPVSIALLVLSVLSYNKIYKYLVPEKATSYTVLSLFFKGIPLYFNSSILKPYEEEIIITETKEENKAEEPKGNEIKEEVEENNKKETTKQEKIKPNYCSSCGARLNKSANYCPECGKKIN